MSSEPLLSATPRGRIRRGASQTAPASSSWNSAGRQSWSGRIPRNLIPSGRGVLSVSEAASPRSIERLVSVLRRVHLGVRRGCVSYRPQCCSVGSGPLERLGNYDGSCRCPRGELFGHRSQSRIVGRCPRATDPPLHRRQPTADRGGHRDPVRASAAAGARGRAPIELAAGHGCPTHQEAPTGRTSRYVGRRSARDGLRAGMPWCAGAPTAHHSVLLHGAVRGVSRPVAVLSGFEPNVARHSSFAATSPASKRRDRSCGVPQTRGLPLRPSRSRAT